MKNLSHRFKAILFDLDGTLIDSAIDLREVTNATLARSGARALNLEEMKTCLGDGLQRMLEKAFALANHKPSADAFEEAMADFTARYAAQKSSPSIIYPGTVDFLQDQKNKGVCLGLCTNKYESATQRILAELGLLNFFDVIVGGDTLAELKPHPLPLLHALEKCATSPCDAVMIGDSTNDLLAAHAANMPCVILRHGYGHNLPANVPITFAYDIADCAAKLAALK